MQSRGGHITNEAGRPWNRQILRTNNERVLLDRLRSAGPTSRAELARATGLSKPTVSAALAHLERAGLVRETGEVATSGRGRSAVLYEADPTAGYVMGIDVGRSWIRVAVADIDGAIAGRREIPNASRDADEMVTAASTTARDVVRDAGLDWSRVVHTVVGSTGAIDPRTREVRYAVNLPGWGRRGLVERMQAELGTALEVHNDANLAALGEHAFGAGQGCPLFVYLLVGTGVGAGIVVEGRLFAGAHGAAGEVGYLPFTDEPADTREARTADRRGMLEDTVGGDALVAAAVALGMNRPAGPKEVFAAARAGDPRALSVVRAEAGRLAHAVAAVAAVLDPALVVLGGGIGDNADLLLDPLREALDELTPLRPELAASKLGGDAVLMGAIATATAVARDHVFESRGDL